MDNHNVQKASDTLTDALAIIVKKNNNNNTHRNKTNLAFLCFSCLMRTIKYILS